ncbi:MAG: extracellular solute-binding protein, partial [Oscillospiraceae bacterium]
MNLQRDIGEDAKHCFMEWTAEIPADAVYYLELVYKSAEDKINKPQIKIELDGKVPYNELSAYSLSRVYSDAEEMRSDSLGNNLIPKQKVIDVWQTERLCDTSGISSSKLTLYLQQGAHNIRISCEQENVSVKSLTLAGNKEVKTDAQMSEEYKDKGIKETPSFYKEFQAEKAYQKSEASLYPQYDRTSPATVPYDPVLIRRNTMGGSGWSENGMWISYKTEDIPQDGLYYLTIKYRQKEAVGIPSFRNIYINGEIPSSSYENVAFPYGVDWQRQTIVDSSGAPCPIYLKKGQNEIKFQIGEGKYGRVLSVVEDSCNQLNDLYAQMVMITGTSPDKYRDYNLEKEIPGLIDQLSEQAKQLEDAAQIFDALSGEKSSESETIRDMVRRLESLIANPRTIHKRISNYRDGISSLYSWLDDMTYQPLEMDYFIIHSRESELPSPNAKFMASVIHTITTFFLSFAQDYNTVGENSTGNSINVWVNMGRDQIQIIRNMVTDKFTPQSGISVRLSVVQTGFIEATLAGSGPDIALGIARGQPVNLASRNALLDFDGYDRFGEIKKRFSDTASVPYEFNDKTYALPCSQTFYMMFYRKDILQKLGIEIPKTWDELNSITPKLQRSHMSIGLPYSIISAAAAVDTGLGAKDLYATLLLQNGGQFYNAEHTSTALDSEAAVNAFKTWCDFYTQYGFDLVYDFYTRFKNGEMPRIYKYRGAEKG